MKMYKVRTRQVDNYNVKSIWSFSGKYMCESVFHACAHVSSHVYYAHNNVKDGSVKKSICDM